MKAINWKKLLPHIIAVVSFLVVALFFCKPALEGKTLTGHDVIQYEGSSQDIATYVKKHGEAPLWTNSMFSGMPTYQIWMPANNVLPHFVNKILTLGLPEPIQFFFLACILFYFLSQVARVNPYVGMVGSLAFGYSTFNAVMIAAGHVTQMWCVAYMPAMLASLMLIYNKKYFFGAGLLALFTATQIGLNHLQVSYYLFIVLCIYTIFCVVRWIKSKEYAHMIKALAFTAGAALVGVMVNAVTLMTTYEYSKETIRGGSLLKDSTAAKGTGLTKDYAFEYSYKPMEAFTVMFPRIYGGSDGVRETGEDSKTIEALQQIRREDFQGLPDAQTVYQQLNNLPSGYWGGLAATSGPPYFGAIVCFLFIVFLFFIKGDIKWWIIATSAFALLLSWGKNFPEFNYFVFDNMPLYNKFRAPSMSLVILQLLWPLAAILGLQYIISNRDNADTWKKLKRAGIATGAVILVMLLAYLSLTYMDDSTTQLKASLSGGGHDSLTNVIKASVEDKKELFLQDIFKGLVIIGIFYLILALYTRKTIKKETGLFVAAILLVLIDLLPVDNTYLNKNGRNEDSWKEPEESKTELAMGKADQQILRDTSLYRVLNLSVSPFQDATTSYFHKSIGGYHAAKIVRYQDVWENKLLPEARMIGNDTAARMGLGLSQADYAGLNMLNTKYIIFANPPQLSNDQPMVITNPNALGPCWFVREVRFANDLKAEMNSLNGLDASQVAIVGADQKAKVTQPAYDSTAKIVKVSNGDDHNILTYRSSAATSQFAVFSEVYYSEGWNAYINDKKTDYIKTNYALRGMNIPAGKDVKIEFKFEPASYNKGKMLTTVGQIIVLLLLVAGIFIEVRNRKKQEPAI